MEEVVFFPVDWVARDAFEDHKTSFTVSAFGREVAGRSVAVPGPMPVVFLAHHPAATESDYNHLISEFAARHRAVFDMCTTVRRKSAWGFTNGTAKLYAQLVFKTKKQAAMAKYAVLRKDGYSTAEAQVDPLLRLFHARDLSPADWITVHASRVPEERSIARYVDAEYECSFGGVSRCASPPTSPPALVIASWDIECYASTGGFPSGDVPGDVVIQIAVTLRRYGEEEPYRRVVFCHKETSIPEDSEADATGVELVCFDAEADVVNAFFECVGSEKVDVLIGYNVQQFDWKYLVGRAGVLLDDATAEPSVDMRLLGKLDPDADPSAKSGDTDDFELISGAFGDNKYTSVTVPGVLEIDLLQWFKKETKHASYTLKAMSSHYLGDTKLDLPAGEIFAKWRTGDPEERGRIAAYAAKDTDLPVRLLDKLCILENTREMANATSVPMGYIFRRGQQVKTFSLLLKKGKTMGYVFPDNVGIGMAPGEKFVGATVLTPTPGAYFDVVAGLDFASLYPTIIRAHNMSPDTLVLDKRYADIEGVEYYEVKTDQGTYRFAQTTPGILPDLLRELAEFRKKAKRDMGDAKKLGDTFAYNLFNAKQLAIKVTMNSMYGFWGASKGFMPCVPIAASVTATGRLMIEKTRDLAESLVPGSKVVYGDTDSVFVIINLGEEKRYDMRAHFEAAASMADAISKTFKHPIELEFEKTFFPLLLYGKKRYAGRMFSSTPDKPDYVDVKGLQLVRRDSCPIVKTVSTAILDVIMEDHDAAKAIEIARAGILEVLDAPGGCDMTPYVMSKSLRGSYKNTEQPHLHVAKRIEQRTGERLPSGTRIPFVYVKRSDETLLGTQSGRAEDPGFARVNGMELDKLYYVQKQLRSPFTNLLSVLDERIDKKLFEDDEEIAAKILSLETGQKVVLKEVKRVKYVRDNNLREITQFFRPAASKQ